MKPNLSSIRSGIILLIGICCITAVHSILVWQFIGGSASMQSRWPFLTHDHTFVYYNAVQGSRLIELGTTPAGYDPTFMSGYVKTSYGSTNLLVPWILFLFRAYEPANVYKWYVVIATSLLPLIVMISALLFRLCKKSILASGILYLVYFWSGFTPSYLVFGMTAFQSSTVMGLFLGAIVVRFFEYPSMLWTLIMGLAGGIACLTHPTIPIVMIPPLVLYWSIFSRSISVTAHLKVVFSIILALTINVHWIWPCLRYYDSLGELPSFFVNNDLGKRLLELATFQDPTQSLLFMSGIIAVLLTTKTRTHSYWMLISVLIWSFFLAYPSSLIPPFDRMQTGRHTLTLFTWLCVVAAFLLDQNIWLKRSPKEESTIKHLPYRQIILCSSILLIPAYLSLRDSSTRMIEVYRNIENGLTASLPNPFVKFMNKIKERCQGTRIFYEERNQGIEGVQDLFGDFRLSGLVAQKLNAELIGGPWLSMHYKTNFCQVGDGIFFGDPNWEAERFFHYTNRYHADWMLCWSPAAHAFCENHPNEVEVIDSFGDLLFVQLKPPEMEKRHSGIVIKASLNRLEIEFLDVLPDRIVLPYHYFEGWQNEQNVQIESEIQGDDPVPFIVLIKPVRKTVLQFSPW